MENQNKEFKKSLSDIDSILKTITAFANNGGGELNIGIDDDGKEIGISIGKNTIENLSKKISQELSPPIRPQINILTKNKKTILNIKIFESKTKPHFFKGIAYLRSGKSNLKMSPQDIESILTNRKREFFDSQLSNLDIESVDTEAFSKFKKLVLNNKRINVENHSITEILNKLNLAEKNKLKNAGAILFSKKIEYEFPYLEFKCAVSTTDKFSTENLIDIQTFSFPFYILIDKIVEYIQKHIPKKIYLEGIVRKEDPIISLSAIREIVVNSLVHRDYSAPSPNYLLITPNFLEISNPGALPPEIDEEMLFKIHKSVLRNPLIAKISYYSGHVDEWGSGTLKIIEECKKNGIIPEFKSEKNFFTVHINFKADMVVSKLISFIGTDKKNTKDIAKHLKVSERTVRNYISELLKKGILKKLRVKNRVFYSL
jgi:ATP-dependent DNA helicase RecG